MKHNAWLFPVLLSLTTAAVLAQDTTPAPPAGAAPAAPAPSVAAPMPETAPAAEPKPKTPRKKAAAVKHIIHLEQAAPALVKSDAVNVRGQPSFNGEILGHLQKGDSVTVQEEITLSRLEKGEPAQWSQIAMPTNIPVWVNSQFIDADSKTVKASKVNLRGGPGENFSIVGRLEKGAAITEVRSENGWTAIQTPTNAYAYVATGFLDVQPAPAPMPPPSQVVNVATPAAPVPATAGSAPTAPAPTAQSEAEQELAALRQATAPTAPAVVPPEAPAATTPATPAPEAALPRVVTREGFVRKTMNVQAPSDYELHDLQTDTLIEYLQPPPIMNLTMFVGTRVMVTGPELMDARWPRTPVLQVQSIGLMP